MYNVSIKYDDNSEFKNEKCTASLSEILKDIWENSEYLIPVEIKINEIKSDSAALII